LISRFDVVTTSKWCYSKSCAGWERFKYFWNK